MFVGGRFLVFKDGRTHFDELIVEIFFDADSCGNSAGFVSVQLYTDVAFDAAGQQSCDAQEREHESCKLFHRFPP